MKIVYTLEKTPRGSGPSLFLAGPTPRTKDVRSWRPRALAILRRLRFMGTVIIPEFRDPARSMDAIDDRREIWDWEQSNLKGATCILFWVPRDMKIFPALTTNIEFGLFVRTKKIVFGAPRGAYKVSYMAYAAHKYAGAKRFLTLEATIKAALTFLNAKRRI